jgi:hypothetical protein
MERNKPYLVYNSKTGRVKGFVKWNESKGYNKKLNGKKEENDGKAKTRLTKAIQ